MGEAAAHVKITVLVDNWVKRRDLRSEPCSGPHATPPAEACPSSPARRLAGKGGVHLRLHGAEDDLEFCALY